VFLSNAERQQIRNKIETASKAHNIPYWRKRFFNDISEFAKRTDEMVKSLPPVR
jgi:hypothetical protein